MGNPKRSASITYNVIPFLFRSDFGRFFSPSATIHITDAEIRPSYSAMSALDPAQGGGGSGGVKKSVRRTAVAGSMR